MKDMWPWLITLTHSKLQPRVSMILKFPRHQERRVCVPDTWMSWITLKPLTSSNDDAKFLETKTEGFGNSHLQSLDMWICIHH